MTTHNLTITQGKTFNEVVRWQTLPFVFAAIAGISNTAPVRITTQASHTIPDGWKAAVVDSGVTQLDAVNVKSGRPVDIADKYYHQATLVDNTHVEFNPLSAVNFDVHEPDTGYLQWYTPHDLAGYTARMSIKDKVGGTVLVTLTTENDGIAVDPDAFTITLSISAADTAAFDWTKGVYDLELISPTGDVEAPLSGKVTVSLEVTT